MAKVLSTGIIVLIVVLLGLGIFAALNYNTSNKAKTSDYNNQYNNDVQNSPENSAWSSVNPCGAGESYSYLCFKYQMLEQEKRDGYDNKPEQIRVEPCPAPKPVCPLCHKGLDQSKGEGYGNTLEQTRINC